MKMWNSKLQFVEQKCSFFIGVVIKSTDGNETEKMEIKQITIFDISLSKRLVIY